MGARVKYWIIAAVLLLLPAGVLAADWTWTKEDSMREVAGTALTVIDWGQTNDIRRHEGMIELNPILGRTPSRQTITNYFATVLVLRPLISLALPAKAEVLGFELRPRLAWQYLYIGVEATATVSNFNGGLRMSF